MNSQRDFGWVIIPLAVIIILLLFVIATKGPPDEVTGVEPAPINVTVELPASPCVITDAYSHLRCGGAQ